MEIFSDIEAGAELFDSNGAVADAGLGRKMQAYDRSCKKLLSFKIILAWILKCCVIEFRDCEVADIENHYIENDIRTGTDGVHPDTGRGAPPKILGMNTEDNTLNEHTVRYDIKFRASAPDGEQIGLIINIEAQSRYHNGYPLVKRGIYYCSRLISAQYGTEFSDSRYGDIRKVYSIWVCTDAPAERRGTIAEYAMEKRDILGKIPEPEENYDLMRLLILCPGDEKENSAEGGKILRLLAALLRKDVAPEKRRQVLSGEFGIKLKDDSFTREVDNMCNLSLGVLMEGYEKGIAEGIAEGIGEGKVITACESAKNLMRTMNIPFDKAVDLLGYDKDLRETCRKRLEQEDKKSDDQE